MIFLFWNFCISIHPNVVEIDMRFMLISSVSVSGGWREGREREIKQYL